MRRNLKRVSAYLIDLFIISILVSVFTNLTFINPYINKYNKYYNELINKTNEYNEYITKVTNYYEDKKIDKKEYNKLLELNDTYIDTLNNYYEDEKIDKKEYNKLIDGIKKDYEKTYIDLSYKIEKNSIVNYLISIIITILYFVVFNIITDGQTLGKKIFHLKIVKKDKEKAKFINYLLRTIILYNLIFNIVSIIGIYTLNKNDYYSLSNIIYNIQTYVQWIIIAMIILRQDRRGLHDMIGNTKVIEINKNGQEIEEKTYNQNEKIIDTDAEIKDEE